MNNRIWTQVPQQIFWFLFLLPTIQAQYVGTGPFLPENGGLIINEVSNGISGAEEYVELIVVGNSLDPTAAVNFEGWIIDDNNFPGGGQGNAQGHLVFGDCFTEIPPGSLIIVYNATDPNPALPPDDPFDQSPTDGIYVLPHNHQCLLECSSNPSINNGNYCPCTDPLAEPFGWQLGLRNSGDIFQVRDRCETLIHGIYWGNISLVDAVNNAPVTIELGGSQSGRVIQFLNYDSDNWNQESNFESLSSAISQSPGEPNSPENAAFIDALKAGELDASGTIADCKDTDAGDLVIPSDLPSGNLPIEFCEGSDLSTFSTDYTESDELEPDASGFTFEYVYLLASNNPPNYPIIQTSFSGDFDLSGQAPGSYIVWGFSYVQTNGSVSLAQFLNTVNSIQDIKAHSACGYDGDLDNLDANGEPVEIIILDGSQALLPASEEICDDGSGTATFDLTDLEQTITDGEGGNVVWYADTSIPTPIDDPEAFTTGTTLVFARVEAGICSSEYVEIALTVSEPPAPEIEIVQGVGCHGDSTAILSVVVEGGNAPFDFNWSDPDLEGQIAENLPAGDYSVTVVDALGCSGMFSITVEEPSETLMVSCEEISPVSGVGINDGVGGFGISGGLTPYMVLLVGELLDTVFTTSQTTVQVPGLSAGDYTIMINDTAGCMVECMFTIGYPDCPFLLDFTVENISCQAQDDGAISLSIFGGAPPYFYQWSNGESDVELLNLFPGNYGVTVTDAAGCIVEGSTEVEGFTPLEAAIEVVDPLCFGDNNGQIILTAITGGSGANYAINIGGLEEMAVDEFPFIVDGLSAGIYDLVVSDEDDCEVVYEMSILEPEELLLELGEDQTITQGEEITINTISNFTIDSFLWEPDSLFLSSTLRPRFTLYQTTTFTLEVFDPNGCVTSDQITILVEEKPIDVFIPNTFSPNLDGVNDHFTLFGNEEVKKIISLNIFDRWGGHVFKREYFDPSIESLGWDGTFRGKSLSPGVYIYFFEVLFITGKEELLQGDILLLR